MITYRDSCKREISLGRQILLHITVRLWIGLERAFQSFHLSLVQARLGAHLWAIFYPFLHHHSTLLTHARHGQGVVLLHHIHGIVRRRRLQMIRHRELLMVLELLERILLMLVWRRRRLVRMHPELWVHVELVVVKLSHGEDIFYVPRRM